MRFRWIWRGTFDHNNGSQLAKYKTLQVGEFIDKELVWEDVPEVVDDTEGGYFAKEAIELLPICEEVI